MECFYCGNIVDPPHQVPIIQHDYQVVCQKCNNDYLKQDKSRTGCMVCTLQGCD